MNVYLPGWMRGAVAVFLLLAWAVISYQVFFTDAGRRELGIVGWALITALLLAVGGVVWAMASRKLAAYVIEEEDEDRS
jgi:hypothetical protein